MGERVRLPIPYLGIAKLKRGRKKIITVFHRAQKTVNVLQRIEEIGIQINSTTLELPTFLTEQANVSSIENASVINGKCRQECRPIETLK